MNITCTDGYPVFEPQNAAELSQWEPSPQGEFQFLKLTDAEYRIFHGATYLGTVTRLAHENAWQAVSGTRRCCVAPLFSLVDCAQCLLSNGPEMSGDMGCKGDFDLNQCPN